ncbi:uncharacterized protein G2W53_029145 [Senna tora]|uniref:Myb/SANT-like domain-containing protein n=1 Tax=Senna tora TaxID=362788 RepID=A0A834T6M7_9FABA|nr:uncharacterized protein G2W53_029145 [Senna tora]
MHTMLNKHSTDFTNFQPLFCLGMSQQQLGGGSSIKGMSQQQQEGGGTCNADNGLKPSSLRDLERKMESRLPGCGLKAIPHIQPRYKSLKAAWKEVFDMVYGPNTSRFGWDSDSCMVIAKEDVCDGYIRSHKCASFRSKLFPLFDQLTELFGKDHANVQDAQTPSKGVGELSKEAEI